MYALNFRTAFCMKFGMEVVLKLGRFVYSFRVVDFLTGLLEMN